MISIALVAGYQQKLYGHNLVIHYSNNNNNNSRVKSCNSIVKLEVVIVIVKFNLTSK